MESEQTILEFMQNMKEDDFSNKVFVPLLKKLNYYYSDFNGGAYEAGKDIIAFKRDDLDQLEVFCAQVKKFKATRSTESRQEWFTIVYQLDQAKIRDIACQDGISRKPTKVAFVTPYQISTRLIEEQLERIKLSNITIIDGSTLYKIILRAWPTMISEVGGLEDKLASTRDSDLKNTELFETLRIADDVGYEKTYSDLNFFVGRADTRELICSEIYFERAPENVSWGNWLNIKKTLLEVEKLVKFEIISPQIQKIESTYAESEKKHKSEENQHIRNRVVHLQREIAGFFANLDEHLTSLRRSIDVVVQNDQIKAAGNRVDFFNSALTDLQTARNTALSNISIFTTRVEEVLKQTELSYPLLKAIIKNLESCKLVAVAIQVRVEELSKLDRTYIPHPTISFNLDCEKICKYFSDKIEWLKRSAESINDKKAATNISKFLNEVESLLSLVNKLVFSRVFGAPVFFLKTDMTYSNRFEISAHQVFDSGRNIAVYGEAGAGKSTTLHMYAKHCAENLENQNSAVVFLPMNRLVSAKNSTGYSELTDLDNGKYVEALIKHIMAYKNIRISETSVSEFFSWANGKKSIVFIIDGFDEAVVGNLWLLKAINALPLRIPNCQVIISSRDCIDEIRDINFLGITLLPFTRQQLQRFVEGWGANGPTLWAQIKETPIADVATNPLLATIACSLHTHGVTVSANEPDLYRKKIELLCGQYDRAKHVSRTKSSPELLEKVARTVAFGMHRSQLREMEKIEVSDLLSRIYLGKIEKESLEYALNELISPCNVLKNVPHSSKISFGHLRYQEFLASEEFVRSRENSVIDYIYDEWWKGSLFLLAFSLDIEAFMERIYRENRSFRRSESNIIEMIKARPPHERAKLVEVLRRYQDQEQADLFVAAERDFDDVHSTIRFDRFGGKEYIDLDDFDL